MAAIGEVALSNRTMVGFKEWRLTDEISRCLEGKHDGRASTFLRGPRVMASRVIVSSIALVNTRIIRGQRIRYAPRLD